MKAREVLGYVFGYGTLADPNDWLLSRYPGEFADPTYIFIDGYRRHWDVAAENAAPDHDNKYHVDISTGERPDIYVAALGLELQEGCKCNGVALPVDGERLRWFDQREAMLYDRMVIKTERISEPLDGTLWTYFPKLEALAAFEEGLRGEAAFAPRYYTEGVVAAFTARGEQALAAYLASTRPPRCPVRDLELFRAPGDAGI